MIKSLRYGRREPPPKGRTLMHQLLFPMVVSVSLLCTCVVAAEIVHEKRDQKGLTARAPWIVALVFGLLHGFGFAGALSEVGLPSDEIPIALLFFNVGVEVGQVAFVLAAVATMWLLSRVRLPWPTWAPRVVPYAVGSVAAFWTIQRTVGFWLPG